jgi:hypothetical protein
MTESMLDHALAYAQQAGIPVLPLKPRQKEPACQHGKDDATTDPDQIRAWWTANPDYNIGIRPPAGVLVLDVDTQHGGPAQLAALFDRHGLLPATWQARTGQGGQHIWLRANGGPFRGKLAPGIDIKHHSGYLVAPPSIHPNGNRYEWLNHNLIAYAPAWVRTLAAPPSPPPRTYAPASGSSSAALVHVVSTAPAGQRNSLLFWAACRAAEAGTLTELHDQLTAAAIANGLDEDEVKNTLKSAARRKDSNA